MPKFVYVYQSGTMWIQHKKIKGVTCVSSIVIIYTVGIEVRKKQVCVLN